MGKSSTLLARKQAALDSPDLFQTPPDALFPLYPHLKRGWVIWECAEGNGNLCEGLCANGFEVIGSDIKDDFDFLTWQPAERWDCIITNPPFTLKDEFLARCYQLGKPFALLLPLTALEGQRRQRLFREHGVEVIFMPRRIHFETPNFTEGRPSSSWFATAWFTHGLSIGRALTFWQPESVQPCLRQLEIGGAP